MMLTRTQSRANCTPRVPVCTASLRPSRIASRSGITSSGESHVFWALISRASSLLISLSLYLFQWSRPKLSITCTISRKSEFPLQHAASSLAKFLDRVANALSFVVGHFRAAVADTVCKEPASRSQLKACGRPGHRIRLLTVDFTRGPTGSPWRLRIKPSQDTIAHPLHRVSRRSSGRIPTASTSRITVAKTRVYARMLPMSKN